MAGYVGLCRACGARTQPHNGKGDAYEYYKRCHPGAMAPDGSANGFAKRCAHGEALRRCVVLVRLVAHASAAPERLASVPWRYGPALALGHLSTGAPTVAGSQLLCWPRKQPPANRPSDSLPFPTIGVMCEPIDPSTPRPSRRVPVNASCAGTGRGQLRCGNAASLCSAGPVLRRRALGDHWEQRQAAWLAALARLAVRG